MVSPVRVVVLAVALSTLSFAAGVAGDLSAPPPASGARVVVRIPPSGATPAQATLLSTRSAEARSAPAAPRRRPATVRQAARWVPTLSLAARFELMSKAEEGATFQAATLTNAETKARVDKT
jgi:hypothetical protein